MKILIVARAELVGRLRSEPPHLIVAMAVIGLAAAAVGIVEAINLAAPAFPSEFRYTLPLFGSQMSWQRLVTQNKPETIYLLLSLLITGLAVTVAPLSIWTEYNRGRNNAGTERLLLLGLDPLAIAGGRLLASLWRSLLIVAAAAPVLSVAWLFGGVPLPEIALTAATWVTTVLVAAAAAQLVGMVFGGNLSGLLYSYALVALLVFGAPSAAIAASVTSGQEGWLPLVFFSPVLAQVAAHKDLTVAATQLLPDALHGIAGYYDASWQGIFPAHLFVIAGLVAAIALAGIMTAVSAVITDPLHVMRAVRPWPMGRRR